MAGFVYVIAAGGLHKIGFSADPLRRLAQVAREPSARVVHHIETAAPRRVERRLHDLFDHLRERGEWFRLSEEDVATVRRLYPSRGELPPPCVPLLTEIDADVKGRFARLARLHGRTLRSETAIALLRYLETEEAAEGLSS